jgi:putative SOS response-associated peptidase YedK
MCNHYRTDQQAVERAREKVPGLALPLPLPDFPEHIYPKYVAPIVIQTGHKRILTTKAWGIPVAIKGVKGQRILKPVTNARNDKLTGFTWRHAVRERRCLIPATGYFEPGLGPPGAKGEILFTVKERPSFFFAGLWEDDAFTMVTTEPNEFVAQFHDRMPVVLDDADALAWLGAEPLPDADIRHLCRGLPADALRHEALPPKLKITRPATTPKATGHDDSPTLL